MVILSKRAFDVNGVAAQATTQVDALAVLDADLSDTANEAPGRDCDATCQCDDSDVNDEPESAGESNVEGVSEHDPDANYRVAIFARATVPLLLRGTFDLDEAREVIKEWDKSDGSTAVLVKLAEIEGTAQPDKGFYQLNNYKKAYATFVRDCLRRHLKQVEDAMDLIEDTGDVGIVARSLAKMCYHIESSDGGTPHLSQYDMGDGGDWRNDELECELGMVGDDAEE